ncbi:MAG: hypothetical protein ACJ789_01505 [Thermomicrobiales bacterium]
MGFWDFFTVLLVVVSAGAVIWVLQGLAHILVQGNRPGNLDQGPVSAKLETEFQKLHESLRAGTDMQEHHIAQLEARFSAVDEHTGQEIEQSLREMRDHLDAELGRFREGMGGALATLAARQESGEEKIRVRQTDAIADLYQRLAKMEAALLAVANPVLLPSERLVLPERLMPEHLAWEQWKEVGDAAFAFADAFNRNRIVLDDATCRDLAAFVTGIREQLTRSVYPSLQQPQTGEQQQLLRQSLEQLAADISSARDRLELVYREIAGRG